jgi:hypothetical protein
MPSHPTTRTDRILRIGILRNGSSGTSFLAPVFPPHFVPSNSLIMDSSVFRLYRSLHKLFPSLVPSLKRTPPADVLRAQAAILRAQADALDAQAEGTLDPSSSHHHHHHHFVPPGEFEKKQTALEKEQEREKDLPSWSWEEVRRRAGEEMEEGEELYEMGRERRWLVVIDGWVVDVGGYLANHVRLLFISSPSSPSPFQLTGTDRCLPRTLSPADQHFSRNSPSLPFPTSMARPLNTPLPALDHPHPQLLPPTALLPPSPPPPASPPPLPLLAQPTSPPPGPPPPPLPTRTSLDLIRSRVSF